MKSHITPDFRRRFGALPADAQAQAVRAYRLFQLAPFHRSLFFKQVRGRPQAWSARVGQHHRVLGIRKGDDIYWFWIGTHAEYDRVIRQL